MNKSKTFNVTVKKTHEFEASVASMFVLSNSAYKGNFESISDLQNIVAHNGDYADVFETNSRWVYENNQWVNTDKGILINPLVVKQSEVSHEAYPNSIVERDDIANIRIAEPQYDDNATTKQYVDLKNTLLDVKIDILQQNVTGIQQTVTGIQQTVAGIQQELGNIGELLDELNGEVI